VQRVLKAARGMLEYLIDTALDRAYGADARERIAIRQEVQRLIREEPDPTARLLGQNYADRVAGALNFRQDKQLLDANAREFQRALGPEDSGSARESAPPSRARSRDQREDIGREVLGIMLDFPELLDTDEAFEAVALLDGDVARAVAAVRQTRVGNSIGAEQVLAKLATSIHPFALARLAAPRHEVLEAARTELVGNIAKLNKLEQKQLTSVVLGELAQADRQGNVEAQNNLLHEKFENARRNLQRGRA
jgi:hypothetical protein